MKRIEIERQAIERALNTTPNITRAAHDLGASRRTLQARMRDYSIPPGHAGRPRTLLPKVHVSTATLAVIGLLVGAGIGGFLIWRRLRARKMAGLDLLGSR